MNITRRRKAIIAAIIVLAAVPLAYAYRERLFWRVQSVLPKGESGLEPGVVSEGVAPEDVTVLASGLEVPWDIAFLPGGDLLVTERPGRLKRITPDGEVTDIAGIADVRSGGEGGLLGVAAHPDFASNGWVYLYQTVTFGGSARNRVDRYRLDGARLIGRTGILQDIPGAIYHDGGKLAFGPDGKLYVTTGDANRSASAQDRSSLAGKILRINDDGTVPEGNPFGTAVWSYGHRNPQGLAWDAQGRLWSTEHGRSGVTTGFDEVNLIEPGKNYGWPTIQGDAAKEGMTVPSAHSGPAYAWAPASAAIRDGSLFFGGLRGEALYEAKLGQEPVKVIAHFEKEYGRLRAAAFGPDGKLYVTTSNRDGRGDANDGDDRLLRIDPRLFR